LAVKELSGPMNGCSASPLFSSIHPTIHTNSAVHHLDLADLKEEVGGHIIV
jgi:hypothetical protein